MKHLLLTTIVAVVLVGCGESQQAAPTPEATPVGPIEPVAPVTETAKPEPPTAKAPDISIHDAAALGNNEAVKQHLTVGTDVNAKDESGWTPLHWAASKVHNKTAKLLIKEGADVNAINNDGQSPLDYAENETFGLLIDHGAKSGVELK
ncbi:MAG: ankyrin repeat domain-containing protein [Pseudomonadales bacterium]|nr:ankyrin repeat domain-containing protein [Pseudomonadales bacterium]